MLHLTLEVEVGMYIIIVLDVSHSVKRKTNKQTATDGGLVVEASSGGAPIVDYGPLRLD